MKNRIIKCACLAIIPALFMTVATAAEPDADAANKLAKSSGCLKCHAVDKTKVGPSYKNVAKKYKGQADAKVKLITFITTGPSVKMAEGMEMTHAIVNTKDKGEQENLVGWILSQ
ncbi:MAG: c-type cytochrome [Gallionella sp.]